MHCGEGKGLVLPRISAKLQLDKKGGMQRTLAEGERYFLVDLKDPFLEKQEQSDVSSNGACLAVAQLEDNWDPHGNNQANAAKEIETTRSEVAVPFPLLPPPPDTLMIPSNPFGLSSAFLPGRQEALAGLGKPAEEKAREEQEESQRYLEGLEHRLWLLQLRNDDRRKAAQQEREDSIQIEEEEAFIEEEGEIERTPILSDWKQQKENENEKEDV